MSTDQERTNRTIAKRVIRRITGGVEVGDRVRVLAPINYWKGSTGTVQSTPEPRRNGVVVVFDGRTDGLNLAVFYPHELEVIG